MLEELNWVIVGSHGRNPICERLFSTLTAGRKVVTRVNPGYPSEGVFASLAAVNKPIDVVNLVVNPQKGKSVVEEMTLLKIKNLWIQPGAESQEIIDFARKSGINVHLGCVLVEARF